MGCSTFSNFTVLPEIAVAKIREDAPFQTSCYIGCGVTTGVGAVVNTAKVQLGDNVVVFGLGGIGLNVHPGRAHGRRRQDRRRRHQSGPRGMGPRFGMTDFVNPEGCRATIVAHLVALTDGGADYTFDCTGNTDVMRTGARRLPPRLGHVSIIIGVAEAGKEIATRPFQLVTGRNWRGTAFGGAKGRTDVPKIVDWYMNGQDRDRPDDHPCPEPRGDQQGLRPDACRREHPQRRRLLKRESEMFSHMMVGSNDIERVEEILRRACSARSAASRASGREGPADLSCTMAASSWSPRRSTASRRRHGNGGTIGFAMDSPKQADAWHEAGVAEWRHRDRGPAGRPREGGFGELYLAYLRDPDGNKMCALHRARRMSLETVSTKHRRMAASRASIATPPRDRDGHDFLGLRAAPGRGRDAAGALVSVGPDLHPRQRHREGRVSRRLRRARPDLRRARTPARAATACPTIEGL